MKTRRPRDETTALPPPPAPTARDANPWTVEAARGSGQPRRGWRPEQAADRDPVKRNSAVPRLAIPVAFVLLMLGLAIMRIRESGDFEDLAGIVFAMVVLVLFAVTRAKAGRRAASRRQEPDE